MKIFIFPIFCVVRIRDNKKVISLPVVIRVVKDALSLKPISTTPAALLNIAFQRFGNRVMDDKSDIFFVDPHSKRYCGNNDLDFIVHPFLLDLLPLCIIQVCVVKIAFDSVFRLKDFSQALTVFSRDTINNARFTLEPSIEEQRKVGLQILDTLFLPDFINQVRPIER